MRRNLAIALLLVIAALLAGCGELDSIKIIHDARSMLELGETVNLQAKGVSSMGFGVKLEDAEWSVSDEKVAAIVGNGTEAVLTALLPGEVVVTATSGDLSGTLAFTVVGELPNPLMFAESFEDGEVGAYPEGWIVLDQETHDGKGHSGARVSADRASDGSQSLKLTSVPDADGSAELVFEQPLLYNRLTVDIWKDPNVTENANLELHTEEGRVGGLFITGSGQLGYRRPNGDNKPYLETYRMPNGQWVTVEFQWNDSTKLYKVYVIADGTRVEVTPSGGTPFEEAYQDGQVVKFKASVTKRDADKVIYIDNLKVYDMAIEDLLK